MQRRPPAKYLTEFYVWMSLGGILGSAFADEQGFFEIAGIKPGTRCSTTLRGG